MCIAVKKRIKGILAAMNTSELVIMFDRIPSLAWLVSSVGRAHHRYRRGHGFKSYTSLNFFQVLSQLLVQWCS